MGLDSSMEAAPVLWGGVPELPAVREGEGDPVRETERVAEVTVLLVPADGEMEADAAADAEEMAAEAADEALAATELAEARMLERAALALERTLETAADPPVRPNWPE